MTISYKALLLAGVAAAGWMMYSAPASACPAPPKDPPIEAFGGLFNTISGCQLPLDPTDPYNPPNNPPSNPPPSDPPPGPCGQPPTLIQSVAAALGLPSEQIQRCAPRVNEPIPPSN